MALPNLVIAIIFENRYYVTFVMNGVFVTHSFHFEDRIPIIEIQLSRLQIYNLHQVWSHLKDQDVILQNITTFDRVDLIMIEFNRDVHLRNGRPQADQKSVARGKTAYFQENLKSQKINQSLSFLL